MRLNIKKTHMWVDKKIQQHKGISMAQTNLTQIEFQSKSPTGIFFSQETIKKNYKQESKDTGIFFKESVKKIYTEKLTDKNR